MEQKRTIIEFLGGDMDGRTLDSWSEDTTERELIDMILGITKDGKKGAGCHGLSWSTIEATLKGDMDRAELAKSRPIGTHQYHVDDRLDDDGEVLIRMKYSVRPAH